MIINLTPHSIDVFATDAPDVIEATAGGIPLHRPLLTLPPSGSVARIAERIVDREMRPRTGAEAVPITFVEYGHVEALPPVRGRTWYVVSLATALAVPLRPDLLVPWRQVRNRAGTVVGCRGLARPCPLHT